MVVATILGFPSESSRQKAETEREQERAGRTTPVMSAMLSQILIRPEFVKWHEKGEVHRHGGLVVKASAS